MQGYTPVQATILRLLREGKEFVLVAGAYIGDVLALQCADMVVSKVLGDGKLEVRLTTKGSEQ